MSVDTKPGSARTDRARGQNSPRRTPELAAAATPTRLPGRRNPRWIALGVVALCLGGLLSFALYTRVASQTTVVGVAHTVFRGEVVEPGDLIQIPLRGGTLPQAVPAARLDELTGQRAVFDLPEGAVVTEGSVAPVTLPADGYAVVGLKLATGRAPDTLLDTSSPVRLVALPPASDAPADKLAGKTYTARVVSQSPGPDGNSILLNVQVKAGQAATVAVLGAQERLTVVRDAGH